MPPFKVSCADRPNTVSTQEATLREARRRAMEYRHQGCDPVIEDLATGERLAGEAVPDDGPATRPLSPDPAT